MTFIPAIVGLLVFVCLWCSSYPQLDKKSDHVFFILYVGCIAGGFAAGLFTWAVLQ